MTTQNTIKTTAAITKELNLIKLAAGKLDERIKDCAIDVVAHMAVHSDVTLVNRLYTSLGKGHRASAMAEWILGCMAVVANTAPNKKDVPFIFSKEKTTNMEVALAKPWYDMKKDPTPDMMFDFQKAVKQLLAKAGNAGVVLGTTPEALTALAVAGGFTAADVPSTLVYAKDKAEGDKIVAERKAAMATAE